MCVNYAKCCFHLQHNALTIIKYNLGIYFPECCIQCYVCRDSPQDFIKQKPPINY